VPKETTTISAILALPHFSASIVLEPGRVTLAEGTVRRIELGPDLPADIAAPDAILSPAFSDTHLHLPQFDSIGVAGLELLDWLEQVIFPAEARWADPDYAGQMADRVAGQLLRRGTVAVGAYATVHPAGAQAALDALAARGISGVVGQVLMDQHAPAELLLPAREALPAAAALQGRGRVLPAVTPRFAVSCTAELLAGAGELARRTGAFVQTHLAETEREIATVGELHGGLGYVEVYARAGLVTPRTIFGHGIHLSDAEHAVLARAGATIAHCPTANRFLRAGTFHFPRARRAGLKVSLGSDVAGGPDRSMARVGRGMLEAAAEHGGWLTGAQVWWQMTQGNALTLGLVDTGVLVEGVRADLVLVRPDLPFMESPDPLRTVLYGWEEGWLERVWVGGAEVGKTC
jgi:guanine deaminase